MQADAGGLVTTSGARPTLAELYETHSRWAVRLALAITNDADLAQDVTQDAFVRVFARYKNRLAPEEFAGYLRRTIVNLCNDLWRRRRVERRHRESGVRDSATGRVDLDARRDLIAALRTLPARQRTVLALKHYEGMTEHEIADVLGTSVGAVKGLTTRGISNLRREMGGRYA